MELWQEILLKTGFALGVISVVMGIAAYSVLAERKVSSWIQGRVGLEVLVRGGAGFGLGCSCLLVLYSSLELVADGGAYKGTTICPRWSGRRFA